MHVIKVPYPFYMIDRSARMFKENYVCPINLLQFLQMHFALKH